MRFVPVKSATQQSVLTLHRTRDLLIRQRTMLVNALRAQLSEFGIIAAQGMANVKVLTAIARNEGDGRIPPLARMCLTAIIEQLDDLQARVGVLERAIHAWHRTNETSRRLETIPGIGPITASAIAATVKRSDAVLLRQAARGLVWPRSATELEWWQRTPRPHLEAG